LRLQIIGFPINKQFPSNPYDNQGNAGYFENQNPQRGLFKKGNSAWVRALNDAFLSSRYAWMTKNNSPAHPAMTQSRPKVDPPANRRELVAQ